MWIRSASGAKARARRMATTAAMLATKPPIVQRSTSTPSVMAPTLMRAMRLSAVRPSPAAASQMVQTSSGGGGGPPPPPQPPGRGGGLEGGGVGGGGAAGSEGCGGGEGGGDDGDCCSSTAPRQVADFVVAIVIQMKAATVDNERGPYEAVRRVAQFPLAQCKCSTFSDR